VTLIANNPRERLGNYANEEEARGAMNEANGRYGGPGFYVSWREPGKPKRSAYVDTTPHAYIPKEMSPGVWQVVLTPMPGL
jgi:hypothetical protein